MLHTLEKQTDFITTKHHPIEGEIYTYLSIDMVEYVYMYLI